MQKFGKSIKVNVCFWREAKTSRNWQNSGMFLFSELRKGFYQITIFRTEKQVTLVVSNMLLGETQISMFYFYVYEHS